MSLNQSLLQVVQLQTRYHNWATREMWNGLANLPKDEFTRSRGTSFDNLQATLTHMFAADSVWLERLKGNGQAQLSSMAVPELTMLSASWFTTVDELTAIANAMTEAQLNAPVEYANSTGRVFQTPAWQILLHVVNHSTGHRGQVNGLIRVAGGQPSSTDLIQFYRAHL